MENIIATSAPPATEIVVSMRERIMAFLPQDLLAYSDAIKAEFPHAWWEISPRDHRGPLWPPYVPDEEPGLPQYESIPLHDSGHVDVMLAKDWVSSWRAEPTYIDPKRYHWRRVGSSPLPRAHVQIFRFPMSFGAEVGGWMVVDNDTDLEEQRVFTTCVQGDAAQEAVARRILRLLNKVGSDTLIQCFDPRQRRIYARYYRPGRLVLGHHARAWMLADPNRRVAGPNHWYRPFLKGEEKLLDYEEPPPEGIHHRAKRTKAGA